MPAARGFITKHSGGAASLGIAAAALCVAVEFLPAPGHAQGLPGVTQAVGGALGGLRSSPLGGGISGIGGGSVGGLGGGGASGGGAGSSPSGGSAASLGGS